MTESKKLTRLQTAVLEDLFAEKLDEAQVLAKHHVRPRLFERWFEEEHFAQQFEQRITRAQRQSRVILARHAPVAATTLVQLMESENQETARKACLDIISLHATSGGQETPGAAAGLAEASSLHVLTPETASRLLAALARDELQAHTPTT